MTNRSLARSRLAVWPLALLLLAPPARTEAAFLTFVEEQQNEVGGVTGLEGAFAVAASPDGTHLYATGANSLVAFDRNPPNGALAFVEAKQDGVDGVDGLAGASAVALSPAGEHLYVTGGNDNAIAVFSRNLTSGALTFVVVQKSGVDGVDGIGAASGVSVSPDGADVYVTGFTSDAIAAFARNTTTGALTFIQVLKQSPGVIDGIRGASGVAVSPDGAFVYVSGQVDNAVVVFSRNLSSGLLTFVQAKRSGSGCVTGIRGATSVTISSDAKNVYVTGFADSSLATFNRDPSTGRLTFLDVQQDGAGGVTGLASPLRAAVSQDGTHVYATGFMSNALVVFSRNSSTGALTFVEAEVDGTSGVNGLNGALGVATSPDDANVYAAGLNDDAVVVFAPPAPPTPTRTTTPTDTPTPTNTATPPPTGTLTATDTPSPTPPSTSTSTAVPTSTATPIQTSTSMPTETPTEAATGTTKSTATPTTTEVPPVVQTPTAPLALTPTPTQKQAQVSCTGDCDGDGIVAVDELMKGVNIALGNAPFAQCPAFRCNGDEAIIDCLVKAVNNALDGCPEASTVARAAARSPAA